MYESDSSLPEPGGDHYATIQRMINETPPFRPQASPEELVREFAYGENRMPAFLALYSRGEQAFPAVRAGLRDVNPDIRRWCVSLADNFNDPTTIEAVIPLLQDSNAQVRNWAVHTLSCAGCKDGPTGVDAVPLLLERIGVDESLRVRRQAVAMLAHHYPIDERVRPIFEQVLRKETDRKIRLHAQQGLERYDRS